MGNGERRIMNMNITFVFFVLLLFMYKGISYLWKRDHGLVYLFALIVLFYIVVGNAILAL